MAPLVYGGNRIHIDFKITLHAMPFPYPSLTAFRSLLALHSFQGDNSPQLRFALARALPTPAFSRSRTFSHV